MFQNLRTNWLRRSKSAPPPKEEMAPGTGSGMSSRGISFASGDGKPGWVRNQLQNIFQPTDNKLAMKLFGSKKALIQGHMHDKDEDLKDLETIYDSLRRKIYEMSE